MKEVILYRRGIQATVGNALAARLAKSTLDLGIPIHTSTRRPRNCSSRTGASSA